MAPTLGTDSGWITKLMDRPAAWLSWAILVVGFTVSLTVCAFLTAHEHTHAEELPNARIVAFTDLFEDKISEASSALTRAAAWLSVTDATPQPPWRAEASAILHDAPALTELQWITPDEKVAWSLSRDGEQDIAAPIPLEAASAARAGEALAANRPMILLAANGRSPRLEIFVPLRPDGATPGLLRANLDLAALLRQIYAELQLTSHLQVLNAGSIVAEVGDAPNVGELFVAGAPMDVLNLNLQAMLLPSHAYMAQTRTYQPEAVFLMGCLATLMVSGLLHQYAALSARGKALRQATEALDSSLAQVSASAAHLETIYSVVPVGLCMLDRHHRFVFVNERMAAISGQPASAHIGRTPIEVNPAMGERLEPFLRYVENTGGPLEGVEIGEKDGDAATARCWLCSFHPTGDARGVPAGIVGTVLDITNIKEAEREKQDLSQQLFQAQKTEALGRLTGGIAHDFNNMLGVIMGSLEFVKDYIAQVPEITKFVERIELAAEHAADLTKRLLAFARQQPLIPRNVDIGITANNLLPLLQKSIGGGIEIRAVVAPEAWLAKVDESALGSALLNLVINARDAMPGGGRLTIEVGNTILDETYAASEVEVFAGEYVVLSVSDTGTGMSADTIARAFEPFFTTKEIGRGSGLGLSMVYGFIKQSRGHIKIYSELGHGTVVKLYLPRGDSDAAVEHTPQAMQAVRGDETILVAEDDALMRETAVRQLNSLGYTVFAATSGAEALQILDAHPDIDLLFSDVVMPGGMTGPDLARQAVEKRPGLKVLFVSGYTDNAVLDHGWLPTGVLLLQKPYRRADLAAKVRRTLMS